jgi:hypothetical protein
MIELIPVFAEFRTHKNRYFNREESLLQISTMEICRKFHTYDHLHFLPLASVYVPDYTIACVNNMWCCQKYKFNIVT